MPEFIPRPLGSYDPTEPLVISYGDLLASRNAVIELIQVLTDQANPPSEFRRDSVRVGIRAGVPRDHEPYMFDDFAAAVGWLVE